jgi:AraC family transcriptional regulator
MNAQVTQLAPIRIIMLRHTGPYEQTSLAFEKLFGWVEAQNVPILRTIGIYWDNPEFVPADKLRSAACVEIPADYSVTDSGGLALILDSIQGGQYATTQFVGPYEKLEQAWSNLIAHTEGALRKTVSENPAFEVYLNDPSDTPADQLITELYLPLA